MKMRQLLFPTVVLLCLCNGYAQKNVSAYQPSPINLATEAGKLTNGEGFAITPQHDGYRIECRMQAIAAYVASTGVTIRSLSNEQGAISMRPALLLRDASVDALPLLADNISFSKGIVRAARGVVVEEYSTSGNGIRQDFLVNQRPAGQGLLRLALAIQGAKASEKDGGIILTMESGRALSYSKLTVSDAHGQMLKASISMDDTGRAIISVDDALAVYPIRIDPTFADVNWVSYGVYPGATGTINCVVRNGTNIYVGGNFTVIGNVRANSIAKWDGTAWSALGAGTTNGTNNQVYVITFDAAGNLYAGGNFTTVNGTTLTPANRVAKFDPIANTWSALGAAVAGGGVAGGGGWVYGLSFDNTNGWLYVGGDFLTANTSSYPYLAKCVVATGTWSAVGASINGIVRTLAINGTTLFAGGAFTQVNGTTTYNRVVKWDGAAWAAMGTTTGINGLVYTFYFDGTDTVYAGGDFTSFNSGATTANRIAKYSITGDNWNAVGTVGASNGVNGSCRAITIDGSRNIYATGNITAAGGSNIYYVAKWNGTSWGALGAGLNNQGYGITFDANNILWVGGALTSTYNAIVGNVSMLYLGRWNGTAWSGIGTGPNNIVYALATDSSSNVYVGGSFTHIGGYYIPYIAKWNSLSATWSSLGTLGFGNQVLALKVVNNVLYAGGSFTTAAGVPANYVAKWNGTSWLALGGGASAAVRAIASDPTGRYIFIGGDFTMVEGGNTGRVAKWDTLTSMWSAVASTSGATAGISDGGVYALAHDGTYLYAGGTFTQSEGVATSRYYMARSTAAPGDGWSIMGGTAPGGTNRFNGAVYALLNDGNGSIYAAGAFTTVGGPLSALTANRVAKWSTSGNAWSIVGTTGNPGVTSGTVSALCKDTVGNIWASGNFTTADGIVANSHKGIACFNGTTWQAVGAGLFLPAGSGNALACNPLTGSVSVGGGFLDSVGLKAASYLGRVDNARPTAGDDFYTLNEDATLTGSSVRTNDTDADGDTLSVTLVSNVTHGAPITLSSIGTFSYTPSANYTGSDTFTYKVSDGRSYSTVQRAIITINAVNDVPSFTAGSNQIVLEDAASQSISNWASAISAGTGETQAVYFDITTSNDALFAVLPSVVVSGANGALTYTLAANASGVATVSVRAHDDGGTANGGVDISAYQNFTITVTAVNDAPSFTKGDTQTVLESAAYQTVTGWATGISAGPSDESAQGISFEVSTTRSSLFSIQPAVSATGVLAFMPAADSAGSATITIRARDNAGVANNGIDTSAWQTFVIVITDINDVPSFTKGADITLAENVGAVSYSGWATGISAGPVSEAGQVVNFDVTNTNNALFLVQPTVSTAGALSFAAATNANGVATVSLRAHDNGTTTNSGVDTSAWQSFTITVTNVNNPPSTPGALLPSVGSNMVPADSLKWGAAIDPDAGDAIRYVVNVSAANDFSSIALVDTITTLEKRLNSFVNHRSLRRGMIYYWRVKAIDNSNASSSWVGGASQPFMFAPSMPASFLLVSPASGAQVQSVRPTLAWNTSAVSSGDTLRYRVEISTSVAFSTISYTTSDISSLTHVPVSDLLNNTGYFWRVWAVGNYGDSTASATANLLNIILQNHPPSLSLPLYPVDNIERKPGDSLSWTRRDVDVGDTVAYIIRLSPDVSFSTIAASKTNWGSTSIALTNLDNYDSLRDNRVYFWQIEAHDQKGGSSAFTNGQNFFVFNKTNDAPTAPFNLRPTALGASGPTDFLRWQALDGDSQGTMPDTLHYSVTIDNNADFSSPLGVTLNLTADSVRIDALTGNSTMLDNVRYYWKIVAIDNHALAGAYSDGSTSFWYNKVNDAPGAPSGLLPAAASAMGPNDTLRFNASVDPDPYDSTTYVLQISIQPAFTALISTDTIRATKRSLKTVSGYRQFRTGATYYWRVKGFDHASAESPWAGGSSQSFAYTSTAPLLPVVLQPADDSILFPTETIQWSPSVDADRGALDTVRYIFEVSTVSAFSRFTSVDTLTDTTILLQNLQGYSAMQDNNRYYWRLMVYDNHGSASVYSATKRFFLDKTNNAPSTPVVVAPVDSSVSGYATRFVWRHSVDLDPGNTVTYTVIGATDSLFTDTVLTVAGIRDTAITLDSLLFWNTISKFDSQLHDTGGFIDNRFYYWSVVAYDNRNAPSNQSAAGYYYCNAVNDTPGIPTGLQPSFGAMTFPTAMLAWTPHGVDEFRDPTRYIIQFSNDSLFGTIGSQDTVLTVSRIQFNALTHATADLTPERFVFWRVMAYDRQGATLGFSSVVKIYYSVHNDPPTTVSGLTPLDSNTILYPTDVLTWNSATDPDYDSVYYELSIAKSAFDSTADSAVHIAYSGDITSTSIALNRIVHGYNRLQTNTVYFWRIRSRDEHYKNGSWSVLRTFKFRSTAPTLVSGLYPVDNTLLRFSDTLRWRKAVDSDAGAADTIHYIIATTPVGSATPVSLDTVRLDTFFLLKDMHGINALQNNQAYVWNVRSMDAHGTPAAYSTDGYFVFNLANSAPLKPIIIYPDSSRVRLVRAFQSLRFSCSDPEHDAMTYRIEIARDTQFISLLLLVNGYTSSAIRVDEIPSYALRLKNDSVYYWRVRATDDKSAESPYSRPGVFKYSQFDKLASAPLITAPVSNAYATALTRFVWQNSIDLDDSIVRYQLAIYADTADTAIAIRDTIAPDTSGFTGRTLGSFANMNMLVKNRFYYFKVSPRSLVDTVWVEGNSSIWRRFLFGDSLVLPVADNATSQVSVVLPGDSTTHEVHSVDNAVTILFSSNTFTRPTVVRVATMSVEGTIGTVGAPAVSADTALRTLQNKIADANKYAMGDPSLYWVREPAFAIQTFSIDSLDTSNGALRDSIILQIAYHDTNNDGYVDGDTRIPVSKLAIFRLNESTNRWEPVATVFDLTGKTFQARAAKTKSGRSAQPLAVKTNHFSVYSILAIQASTDPFDAFSVYPSPYVLGTGGTTVNISYRLNENADIQIAIYSQTGGLVWEKKIRSGELYGTANPLDRVRVPWNGRNGNNRLVGNGVYLVMLKAKVQSGTVYNRVQYLGVVR